MYEALWAVVTSIGRCSRTIYLFTSTLQLVPMLLRCSRRGCRGDVFDGLLCCILLGLDISRSSTVCDSLTFQLARLLVRPIIDDSLQPVSNIQQQRRGKASTHQQISQQNNNSHLPNRWYINTSLPLNLWPKVLLTGKIDTDSTIPQQFQWNLEVIAWNTADDDVADGEAVFHCPAYLFDSFVTTFS